MCESALLRSIGLTDRHVGVGAHASLGVFGRRWDRRGLKVPDLLGVLTDRAVRAELARAGDTLDGHAAPGRWVAIGSIHAILRHHIAVEVVADEVVVATVDQRVNQVNESLSVSAEGTALNRLIDTAKFFANIAAVTLSKHLVLSIGHLLHVFTEDEHIMDADFLGDLNVSAIHGANNETTIHHKLHV